MNGGTTAREQWLRTGQELMRDGGIGSVKLRALTERLPRTTGSFYHHFSGMAAYLDELARYYGTEQTTAVLALADDEDPRRRLRKLDEHANSERMRPLDAAMRDWAGSNRLASEAVRNSDTILLRFIEQAFVDLGCDQRGAEVRAHLFYAAGVARVVPPWAIGPDMLEEALDILAPATPGGRATRRR